jgi:cytochrome oxidase Cu insertion factor (SCO1/SenC/PrrC family)
MRREFRLCFATAILAALIAAPALSAEPLSIGREAPAFSAPDARGKNFDLAAYRGKKSLILVFYRGYF